MTTEALSPQARRFLSQYGALHPSSRFTYVMVHALADEVALLHQLGQRPEDCVLADCYWGLGSEIAFVAAHASSEPTFASYRPERNGPVAHKFYVKTRASPLTTEVFERILAALESWLEGHRQTLPQNLLVFTQADLGMAPGPSSAG